VKRLNKSPEIAFSVFRPNSAPEWLIKKKSYLEKKWNNNRDGKKLVRKIIKTCNLPFSKTVLDSGINVTLKQYSHKKYGGLLGSVLPTSPRRITLFVKKKDRYSDLKATLCHELIHSLMWSTYYFDNRRTAASLFADIFADELLTTMLEELIIQGQLDKVDFAWAFDYARKETYYRLKNLKREKDYRKILGELKTYLRDYRKAIREGSNALKERQRALRDILSPLPLVLDE
jgi:hypothetical protein